MKSEKEIQTALEEYQDYLELDPEEQRTHITEGYWTVGQAQAIVMMLMWVLDDLA